MIKSIELKNIQAHEHNLLEFDKGINAIVGSSNNGKTSIIRALNWNRYNRPLGVDTLASHWIMGDKGIKGEMSVTVINDGNVIVRKRTKNENQYIVNNEVLNVVKTDVPIQVENALLLTETNIQNQQDSPFLLSETSGKVAEYFNRVVRLDIIDKVLSKAESTRRKTNQEIQVMENLIQQDEKKLEQFDWLDKVEKLLVKIKNVQEKNNNLSQQVDNLSVQINEYESCLKNQYNFIRQEETINEISLMDKNNKEILNKINTIETQIDNYLDCRVYSDFSEQKKLYTKIVSISEKNDLLLKPIDVIETQIDNYKINKDRIKSFEIEVKELKEQLPDICPICGNKM